MCLDSTFGAERGRALKSRPRAGVGSTEEKEEDPPERVAFKPCRGKWVSAVLLSGKVISMGVGSARSRYQLGGKAGEVTEVTEAQRNGACPQVSDFTGHKA